MQLVLERGDHVGVQAHHHMGKALAEGRDNVGERRGHKGIERADLHHARQLRFLGGKDLRTGDGADDIAGIGDEVLAVLRDGDVLPDAVKQTHTQLALKLLDLHGDGGLGIVQCSAALEKLLSSVTFRNVTRLRISMCVYLQFQKIK